MARDRFFGPTNSGNLCLAAVGALPALSYPLSWLPHGWAQSRFSLLFPWAVGFLVVLLILAMRQAHQGEWVLGPPRILWPGVGVLASWILAVRFSQHPHLSLGALAVPLGGLGVWWMATRYPAERLGVLCWCWLGVAAAVAANGLLRLSSEKGFSPTVNLPELISTFGNPNFLGAYSPLRCRLPSRVAESPGRTGQTTQVPRTGCDCGRCGQPAVAGGAPFFSVARRWAGARRGRDHRGRLFRSGKSLAPINFRRGAPGCRDIVCGSIHQPTVADRSAPPVIWKSTLAMIADRPILGHGLGLSRLTTCGFARRNIFSASRPGI